MTWYKCPDHGGGIAVNFCGHAISAVETRTPMKVYLQKDQYGWYTLCPECALLPKEKHVDEVGIACPTCVTEWANETGTDYLERAQSPTEEHPGRSG